MVEMDKVSIRERLQRLADDVDADFDFKGNFEVILAGSSALIAFDLVSDRRKTTDIDVLLAADEIKAYFYRYDMNDDMDTFRFSLASRWYERTVPIDIDSSCISFKALSPEDLFIAKLISGKDPGRRQDDVDLLDMVRMGSVDWAKLTLIMNDPTEIYANCTDEDDWESLRNRFEAMRAPANEGKADDEPDHDARLVEARDTEAFSGHKNEHSAPRSGDEGR